MNKILISRKKIKDLFLRKRISETIINELTEVINPALEAHSGAIMLLGIKLKPDVLFIKLGFVGNCTNCKSTDSTKEYVSNYLDEEIKDKFPVKKIAYKFDLL